jgi:hypothetical protein
MLRDRNILSPIPQNWGDDEKNNKNLPKNQQFILNWKWFEKHNPIIKAKQPEILVPIL